SGKISSDSRKGRSPAWPQHETPQTSNSAVSRMTPSSVLQWQPGEALDVAHASACPAESRLGARGANSPSSQRRHECWCGAPESLRLRVSNSLTGNAVVLL